MMHGQTKIKPKNFVYSYERPSGLWDFRYTREDRAEVVKAP